MGQHQILLLSGKQGSGKTTISRILAEELRSLGHTVAFYKFADPLYSIAAATISQAKNWGLPVPEGKPGRLLQLLGTDWGRECLGEDVWVKCAQRQIEEKIKFYAEELEGKNFNVYFIIDDCRFKNELDAFPGALKVRLEADYEKRKSRTDGWRETSFHPSETGLDNSLGAFDLVLKNETHDDLDANVASILHYLTSL